MAKRKQTKKAKIPTAVDPSETIAACEREINAVLARYGMTFHPVEQTVMVPVKVVTTNGMRLIPIVARQVADAKT